MSVYLDNCTLKSKDKLTLWQIDDWHKETYRNPNVQYNKNQKKNRHVRVHVCDMNSAIVHMMKQFENVAEKIEFDKILQNSIEIETEPNRLEQHQMNNKCEWRVSNL